MKKIEEKMKKNKEKTKKNKEKWRNVPKYGNFEESLRRM